LFVFVEKNNFLVVLLEETKSDQ